MEKARLKQLAAAGCAALELAVTCGTQNEHGQECDSNDNVAIGAEVTQKIVKAVEEQEQMREVKQEAVWEHCNLEHEKKPER